jgi:hypothetical protein
MSIKYESGIEKVPFLMMFQGKNSIHEGDREKASSILQNLVYKPARDLGKFKYIFSSHLREKYFDNLDKSKLHIEDKAKLNLGQISKQSIGDVVRLEDHLKVIDRVWKYKQAKKVS